MYALDSFPTNQSRDLKNVNFPPCPLSPKDEHVWASEKSESCVRTEPLGGDEFRQASEYTAIKSLDLDGTVTHTEDLPTI